MPVLRPVVCPSIIKKILVELSPEAGVVKLFINCIYSYSSWGSTRWRVESDKCDRGGTGELILPENTRIF